MADLTFLLFLVLFWIISLVLKKLGGSYEYEEVEVRREPTFKEAKVSIPVKEESKREEKEIKTVRRKESEVKIPPQKKETKPTSLDIADLLESNSFLKKAFLLSEILNKPVSERQQ